MFLALLVLPAFAFYLPGVTYHEYPLNSSVEIYAQRLDSVSTQLPFDYYFLPFCPSHAKAPKANFGQVLRGENTEMVAYQIQMQVPQLCKTLCRMEHSLGDLEKFRWMIERNYRISWTVDGLPVGLRQTVTGENYKYSYYQDGFPIGFIVRDNVYLYNHLHIVLQVHQTHNNTGADDPLPDSWIVVGALVNPMSLKPSGEEEPGCLSSDFNAFFTDSQSFKDSQQKSEDEVQVGHSTIHHTWMNLTDSVLYSYSVVFEPSEVKWASRWDMYMYLGKDSDVHWLSIINSFAMVLFLSGLIAHILGRSLRRDIRTYNDQSSSDFADEVGWKQLNGDVFRPPTHPAAFTVVISSGVQLLCVANITLCLSCLGFLVPEHRGWLLTTVLLSYAAVGSVAGFSATKLYITFGGQSWKKNLTNLALFYPGVAFTVFFLVNLCIWAEGSSGAVPFLYLLYLLFIWLGVSTPLVFLGGKVAMTFGKEFTYPCKTARIPKPLTTIPDLMKLRAISVLAGSLPFGCMYLELSYVMQSLWHHTMFYYLFGFLMLCFMVLMVTSAEISVLMTYILLCREDPRWWWWSFAVSGSSGLYFFLYSVVYFFSELSMTRFSSIVLYFGYMLLGSVTYALVTGAVGFWAAFYFVRGIYGMIRVE